MPKLTSKQKCVQDNSGIFADDQDDEILVPVSSLKRKIDGEKKVPKLT
jgi:hypothetical protein